MSVTVLFVSYSGLLGGGERILLDAASGFDVPPLLACPEGPLAGRARLAGLHVITLRARPLELRGGVRRSIAAAAHLAALRRDVQALSSSLRPDVVVAWGMRAALASLLPGRLTASGKSVRPRVVFAHHDLLPGPAVARAVRVAARRADAIVTSSACSAADLGLPATVIPAGVELERFEPAPPSPGPPDVLVLGAITPWKRPELALEVAALAARELPDLRLRLGGEPIAAAGERLLEALRRRSELPDLAGRVELAGSVDAAEALRRAHCLLHCADREPFGLVMVEALAAGRPVVAPAACGPLEIVDESCGALYPAGDAEAAAASLVRTLADAERMGRAARLRAESEFDVERTRSAYRELIAPRKPSLPADAGVGVAFVTVTHDSERELPALLASARAHMPQARVVVADSGSSDASAELARAAGATVIELGENVGFGRASNAGLAAVEEPVTVLVNPDVELLDDSLARLPADLLDSARERIFVPLVLLPEGSRQDVAQAEPGSPAAAAIALVPPMLMPRPLRRAACPWTADTPRRVGWAVGACVVARTDTLRRLGPFDERVFLYAEDLDLGLRAADAGIETWFRPDARVLHRGAHSSEAAFGGEPFELLARRRRQVVAERRGRGRAALDDLLQAATFADRILLKSIVRRDTRREREQLRALMKARRP